jgi:hypothetical protein
VQLLQNHINRKPHEDIMTPFELLSSVIAIVAVAMSIAAVVYNGVQVKQAAKAILLQQQIERGNAVMHFTERYFELVKEGDTFKKFNDETWSYQFWSLHATEFYFFHHGILPEFMYSLWIIDLANLYSQNSQVSIRASHTDYLQAYSSNYPEMIEFYSRINEIAKHDDDVNLRNNDVAVFVNNWISKNKRELLK